MKRVVMEAAGLEFFAELGLILFVLGFVSVLIRVALLKRDEVEHMESLPLDDAQATQATRGEVSS